MSETKSAGKILFVDDEKNIIRSLQRTFFDTEFEIFTALSAEEGLRILEENQPFDIVVSDFKMPSMNGVEFFEVVEKKWPGTNRIFLSGYVEMDIVVRSIIRGLVSNYFIKPWNDEFLVKSITHLVKVRKILHSERLLTTISSFGQLPVLPETYNNFLKGIEQDLPSRKLAAIIEQDTAISTKLLQLTNTAFYNLRGKRSVLNTLVTLGLNAVKNILLMISLENTQTLSSWQKNELEKIFSHSALVNHYIQKFYKIMNEAKMDTSIGITHDIGKILLLMYAPDQYKKIINACAEHNTHSFYDVEQQLMPTDVLHTAIGAYFLDYWNLPQENIEGALFHHSGDCSSSQYNELIDVLRLCNFMIHSKEKGINFTEMKLPKFIADKFPEDARQKFYEQMEAGHE